MDSDIHKHNLQVSKNVIGLFVLLGIIILAGITGFLTFNLGDNQIVVQVPKKATCSLSSPSAMQGDYIEVTGTGFIGQDLPIMATGVNGTGVDIGALTKSGSAYSAGVYLTDIEPGSYSITVISANKTVLCTPSLVVAATPAEQAPAKKITTPKASPIASPGY